MSFELHPFLKQAFESDFHRHLALRVAAEVARSPGIEIFEIAEKLEIPVDTVEEICSAFCCARLMRVAIPRLVPASSSLRWTGRECVEELEDDEG